MDSGSICPLSSLVSNLKSVVIGLWLRMRNTKIGVFRGLWKDLKSWAGLREYREGLQTAWNGRQALKMTWEDFNWANKFRVEGQERNPKKQKKLHLVVL